MKTFTKHILLLALMLFGVAGAAWALPDRAPQKFTGPVAKTDLVQGDTLAPGFSITGLSVSNNLGFDGNRYKQGGVLGTGESITNGITVTGYGGDNPVAIIISETIPFTPVDESGQDGNAWVVTYNSGAYVFLSGIYIAPDPTVPALDELTGHWNFLMPGSNKVVKAVLLDSIVVGPHVTVGDLAIEGKYANGTDTVYYYDTNSHSSITLMAANNDGQGRNFGYWADLDPTDLYYSRRYRHIGSGFTCGDTFRAVYPDLHTLTLAKEGYGTVELDSVTTDTIYTITLEHEGTDEGDRTFTIPASLMPYDTTFNYNANITFAYAYDQVGGSVSMIAQGNHTVTVRISGAFEYGGYYSCDLEGGGSDVWSISCKDSIGLVPRHGISKTADNTYSVMEGLPLSVTATPEEGFRLTQWSDQTEPVEGDARLGGSHPFTMPSTDATLTATFVQNPTLILASNNGEWGTVTLDGITPGATTYDITIEGGNTYTNVSFPFHTTVFLHEELSSVDVVDQTPLIAVKNGNNADITINGPYGGTIMYAYGAGEGGHKAIFCDAIEGLPIMPEGVTYAGNNTYSVLPGTQLKVIATPDSAHYFVNWNEEAALNSNTAVEKTLTMGFDAVELTANFAAKPTLTVVCNGNEKGTMELTEVPQETLLTTINSNSTSPKFKSGSRTFDNIATVTFTAQVEHSNNDWGWWGNSSNSTMTVSAAEGYTITRVKFFCKDGGVMDSQAPFEAQLIGGGGVSSKTWMMVGNARGHIGVTKIEVYGYCNSCPPTHLVNVTDSTYLVDYGTTVRATATAKDGYHMDSWSNGAAVTDLLVNNNTITVTTDSTIRANFIANPLLTLASNNGDWGTVELEGYTPGETTYDITIEGGNTYTNVSFPYQTTVSLHNQLMQVNGANPVSINSFQSYGSADATITISEPFDGSRTISYYYDEIGVPKSGSKTITCTANHSDAVYPDGVTAGTTANTFRVLPGTEVKVIATPDSAHYFVNWTDSAAVNSNTGDTNTLTMGFDDTELTANFELKPTLTLAHNDGGEMEAIVPQGGVTAIVPPTDQISGWEDNNDGYLTENDIPAELGFVAVDQAAAEAWTGAPATGDALLIYGINGENFYYLSFNDGSLTGNDDGFLSPGSFYQRASAGILYITTGVTPNNVTASTEPNTYYIDYNTSVTVKATPSDTAYLVRFDNDADINSNVAVEKTYGPLTGNVTSTATFNDKPVLTLAQNESWGSVSVSGPVVWNNQVWGSWDMISTTFPQTIGDITITKNNFYCYYSYGKLFLSRSVDNNSFVTFTSAGDNFTRIEMTYTGGSNLEPANEWTCENGVAVWEGNAQSVTITNANDFNITQIKFIRGAGIAQLTDNTYRIDYGTTVTVKADATELHHVANWVDADSVAYPADSITYSAYFITEPVALFPDSSTLTITVTADTVAKAIFGINSYDVVATAELDSRANVGTDTSMGHINVSYLDIQGDAQTVDYTDTIEITAQGGSLTTLVAKPHYGYLFTGWYDADADTIMADADTLRITEAYKLEARFVPDTFEIVLTNRQPRFGTVVLNNSTQTEINSDATSVTERYAYRDSIILSVKPIVGYHFNNWNDNDTNNPRVFQLTQDTAFAAIISINRYQVHFGVADGKENYGTVVANYPVHYVCNHGYTAFFKAIAAEGYHFVKWSNGLTDDSVSFRIIQDTDMVATFAPNPYSVVALCDAEQGSTTGTGSYDFGDTATITATAEYGYHFTAWSDGDTNAERTIAIDFTHDTTVTALFAPDQYTVTVLSSDSTMGSVSGTGTYDYLTQVEIAATANEHYYFLQWTDNSTDADNATRTVTVTGDTIYTALFAADTHTLTLASNNAIMGSISLVAPAGLIPNEDGSYTIAYGTEVTVKATASNRCFELGNWGTSDTTLSTDSIYTFTMEGDLALKATFANHLFTSDTVVDVCDRFVWNGVTYTETPEVAPKRNYTTTDGCDSALVLNLTVRHSSTEGLYVSACNSYSWYEYTDMTYSQSVSHTFEGANVEGCDSIVTLYLTIGDVAITNLYVDTCDSYTWKDVTYTETPEVAPSYTYHTAANCDSIVTLYLTIGHPSAGVETIVACSAIEWHDSLYSESTNEPVWHTTNVSGCDSTVTLNLTITPEIATVETVEACDSYEWHDSVYTASTDSATYTATSIHGCDSTVTLHLTINHSNTAVETVEACNEYEWHGVVYTESTNLPTYTTTNAAGCDSTVTLNLTIKESASAIETVEACDEYKWHDSTYTESSNLPTYTTEGSNGCDSVTTLNLTINHSTNVTVTVTACDSYEWHDSVYTETPAEAPVYIAEGSNGCDSVTTLMLTIATSGSSEETVEACDEYTWINDSTYTETPAEDPVYTVAGDNCSTTVTLHLTIKHSVESSLEHSACVGYAWSGNYYEESGVYTKTFEAGNGCDSVVTLTLTVNQPVFNSIEAEACGSYEWNNQTYVASGVYRQTLEAENGCDSVVTLTLTVKQAASTSFSITVCDSYTWNDSVYTASGVYTQTFEGANGCDSTVTLNLTVNTNAGVEQTVEACDSYLWNGQTYTTSGNYSVSFTDGNNCVGDSVLHLTVNASASENVEETVCDSYTWNGNTYTASGVYTYHTSTVAGCDSTVTLTLTVNYSDSSAMSVTACDSYTWNDGDSATYTESGVYTYNYTTEGQCAGVKVLNLTINVSTSSNDTVEACETYIWNNQTYTESGDYTYNTTNVAGCDSTANLHLIIKPVAYTTIEDTVCDSYTWYDDVYTHSGVYFKTFDGVNGCDSNVTLTLVVNHSTTGSEVMSTCTAYEWNGQTYYESGVYYFDTTNAAGCDSTVTLLLNILQGVQTTVVENACDSYTWNDSVYTESGVYNQAFQALNGCDSIVTLTLTINNSVSTGQAVSSCVIYDWNNQTYTESGVYTQVLTARNGCDSTVTLTLTINQPATETVTVETCDGYDWNGVYYTVSGVYTYSTSTVAGCDSTVTLNLTVNYSDDTTLTMQGEGRITWNNEVFTESGRYERVLSTVHGCDSTVTLNLSILPEGMPVPYLYNLMDVALMINHNEAGSENVHYVWYRWYRDGELVLEGPDKDSYSEGGSKLNGCYYLEVATDESLEYWVRSNTVCVGTVGIDEAEELSFTIAPNPVTYGSVVNVAVEAGNADLQGAEIHVYDVHGREVLSQKNNGYIVAELPSGMYMVRLTLSDGRTGVKRLIVR